MQEIVSRKKEELLAKKFKVIISPGASYIHFGDKYGAIGYYQYSHISGESYSTINKPDKYFGTGTSVNSIEEALKQDNTKVRYYKNIEDFYDQYWDKSNCVLVGNYG